MSSESTHTDHGETPESVASYTLQSGDRLRHRCAHFAGELGEIYEVAEVFEHPGYDNNRVVRLTCVSDRRYKDRVFIAAKIERNVNNCSERYGRGDTQRFEPVDET